MKLRGNWTPTGLTLEDRWGDIHRHRMTNSISLETERKKEVFFTAEPRRDCPADMHRNLQDSAWLQHWFRTVETTGKRLNPHCFFSHSFQTKFKTHTKCILQQYPRSGCRGGSYVMNRGRFLTSSPRAGVNNVTGFSPTMCSSSLTQMLVQNYVMFLNSTNHQQAIHNYLKAHCLFYFIQ